MLEKFSADLSLAN